MKHIIVLIAGAMGSGTAASARLPCEKTDPLSCNHG